MLLWACLLLGFAYMLGRTVAVSRSAPAPPGPGEYTLPEDRSGEHTPPEDRSPITLVPPAADAAERLRRGYDILTRHQPRTPVDGWQPQCPWCGSFSMRVIAGPAAGHGLVCRSCGHRCQGAGRESWPDTVLSHRRRNLTADDLS